MPKKKTRKSVAKRCKVTGGGKIKFSRPGRSHLLGRKSGKRKRHLRRRGTAVAADNNRLRELVAS